MVYLPWRFRELWSQSKGASKGTYKGYEIISAPPSSSGGTHVVQLLNILENYDLKELGHNTTESLHLWSEACKLVFADRGEYMADTDFVDVPLAGLLLKNMLKNWQIK